MHLLEHLDFKYAEMDDSITFTVRFRNIWKKYKVFKFS